MRSGACAVLGSGVLAKCSIGSACVPDTCENKRGCACRFDTVYMDDRIRIAKDIRGDTLIVANDGPPARFG